MKFQKFIFLVLLSFLIYFYCGQAIPLVFSQNPSKEVSITVRASVCGNGIIEGNEDCEGEDLNNQTCKSLGYGGGTLVCDIACSFDTFSCWPLPTPTPTPTPVSTNNPVPTLTSISSLNYGSAQTATPFFYEVTVTPIPSSILPSLITAFDVDRDGKVEAEELYLALKTWVSAWKEFLIFPNQSEKTLSAERCDLNNDYECNLYDFSILLYYVER